jgi:hypothetical protein
MPDIIAFATTGVVYKNGSAVVGGGVVGGNAQTIPVKIERSVIVAQSGILDTRFDEIRYYSSSG